MDYIVNPDGTIYSNKSCKLLKPQKKGSGYLGVSLRVGGKTLQKYVHRLVAEKYLPNPNNLPEVNHIDGDMTNNEVSNLEWCDRQHNVDHAVRTGLHPKGTTSGQSKLTAEQVRDMRKLRKETGISYHKLAPLFGVTAMAAHGVCTGKSYNDVV
jgi:hypothetical protein